MTTNITRLSSPLIKYSDSGLLNYLREIQKFPMLTQEEEYQYGMRFRKTGDNQAAKMLVQSHLRLVVKIATKFKNYNLPIVDLIAEGNIGLVQAVKKFDPTKGFRFSTYAMWWIKAYIQEYILHSWSLVKIGTTANQKKLFFNLNKIKKKLKIGQGETILPEQIKIIAHDLNVDEKEVIDMNSRMQNSDSSLNVKIGEEEDSKEIIDNLISPNKGQEDIVIENQEKSRRELLLKNAILQLNDRERDIVAKRHLTEQPLTFDELSKVYKISKERVRQIEFSALEKIKKKVSG